MPTSPNPLSRRDPKTRRCLEGCGCGNHRGGVKVVKPPGPGRGHRKINDGLTNAQRYRKRQRERMNIDPEYRERVLAARRARRARPENRERRNRARRELSGKDRERHNQVKREWSRRNRESCRQSAAAYQASGGRQRANRAARDRNIEAARAYDKARYRRNRERVSAFSRGVGMDTSRSGCPWTPAEVAVAMRSDLLIVEAAAILHRSPASVQCKRTACNRKLRNLVET